MDDSSYYSDYDTSATQNVPYPQAPPPSHSTGTNTAIQAPPPTTPTHTPSSQATHPPIAGRSQPVTPTTHVAPQATSGQTGTPVRAPVAPGTHSPAPVVTNRPPGPAPAPNGAPTRPMPTPMGRTSEHVHPVTPYKPTSGQTTPTPSQPGTPHQSASQEHAVTHPAQTHSPASTSQQVTPQSGQTMPHTGAQQHTAPVTPQHPPQNVSRGTPPVHSQSSPAQHPAPASQPQPASTQQSPFPPQQSAQQPSSSGTNQYVAIAPTSAHGGRAPLGALGSSRATTSAPASPSSLSVQSPIQSSTDQKQTSIKPTYDTRQPVSRFHNCQLLLNLS